MKIKNQILYFVTILSVALMTFSCNNDDSKEVVKLNSIVEIAKADPANFSILLDALKKTSLDVTLSNPGSYTVFAPTNAAFTAAGYTSASINAMVVPTDNVAIANLKLVLQNHVLGVGTKSDDLLASGYFKTFAFYKSSATATSGANLNMFINRPAADVLLNGGATNGGAKITSADIQASNGVVHVIDAVLKLPTLINQITANPALSSLLGLVLTTPQVPVFTILNGATSTAAITLYAPNNDAFTAAKAAGGYLIGKTDAQIINILRYHMETGNRTASSATSYTSSTTTTDVSVSTLYTPNKFTILVGTVKIKDIVATSNATIKTINVQGTNGVIQIIDKVLQPFL